MGLSKERLKQIIDYIKSNTGNALVIEHKHHPLAFFPTETVSVNDMFEILHAMKDSTSITYVDIPPTPCSCLGEPAEKLIVPALINAIKAKAETNKLMMKRLQAKL